MQIPHFSQSPRDFGFFQDPYPFYDEVRDAGALFFWEDYHMPCTAQFRVVDQILRDKRFVREVPQCVRKPVAEHLLPFHAVEENSMLEREPPLHTKLRSHVMREFTSRKVADLRPQIEAVCHSLIDAFPSGPFDLLSAYAEQVPVRVISKLLGVPAGKERQLLDWSHAMVAMYQARRDREVEDNAVAAAVAFSDYVSGLMAERKQAPEVDMISNLVGETSELSKAEVISTVILLLNAGHEATVHTICNGVATLLLQGANRQYAFADQASTRRTSNEIVRFDPPLHMFDRYASEPIELFGHRFEEGNRVGLMLAAANRDSAVFQQPNTFDLTREVAPTASFGAGIHFCVGAPLAWVELDLALSILFARCPQLSLEGTPTYADRYHFHGFEELIVSV